MGETLIDRQIVAPVRLTKAALPSMIARGPGAIISVTSLLAFSAGIPPDAPLPKRATYAASKPADRGA